MFICLKINHIAQISRAFKEDAPKTSMYCICFLIRFMLVFSPCGSSSAPVLNYSFGGGLTLFRCPMMHLSLLPGAIDVIAKTPYISVLTTVSQNWFYSKKCRCTSCWTIPSLLISRPGKAGEPTMDMVCTFLWVYKKEGRRSASQKIHSCNL